MIKTFLAFTGTPIPTLLSASKRRFCNRTGSEAAILVVKKTSASLIALAAQSNLDLVENDKLQAGQFGLAGNEQYRSSLSK